MAVHISPVNSKHCRIAAIYGLAVLLTLSTFASVSLTQSSGIISTVAGTGLCGFSNDRELAIHASLNTMQGLATDAAGDLYFAEITNNVIRKIDATTGMISTIAGRGPSVAGDPASGAGFSGDGGPATEAKLATPSDVAFGPDGLYIADLGNNRIRRIDANGIIITVVGTGERGFGGDYGPALEAKLNYPACIAFDDAGNLYIGDVGNYRVRVVDRESGIIFTIAGAGVFGFSGDDGPALQAKFKSMSDIAIGPDRGIYVADAFNARVRRIGLDGMITSVLMNVPPDPFGEFPINVRWPQGLAFDAIGNLYIADVGYHRVLRLSPDGKRTVVAGTIGNPGFNGDGGLAADALLNRPSAVAFDLEGNLFISDSGNCRVRKVSDP